MQGGRDEGQALVSFLCAGDEIGWTAFYGLTTFTVMFTTVSALDISYTSHPNDSLNASASIVRMDLIYRMDVLNPFIEADVSLIKNVDSACKEIRAKEERLNLLFMTPGGISLSGRRETPEGINHLFSLRYYARMRFIQTLLLLLSTSTTSTTTPHHARVISIFGGPLSLGPLHTTDLSLKSKSTYSILTSASHALTMTSLSMEHLAATHPSVSVMHAFPGLVRSDIYSNGFPRARRGCV
ncbi:hypothetical protein FQN55_002394 [Onygenales sp. PD_40]|nr:hypothetical protein FQN55_002394 [Onygenales sp. PD_40]